MAQIMRTGVTRMSREAAKAVEFVRWAREKNPELYKRIASKVIVDSSFYKPRMLAGLGAADGGVDATVEAAATQPGFMDSLTKIISSLGTYQAQKDCAKYNLELIKAGRATVSCGDVAGGVNIGLDANTRNLLTYGGLILAGLVLFSLVKKGR
jgi:hypothetical protein